jgi:branched-chain amino acid transport system ATP-binding protein
VFLVFLTGEVVREGTGKELAADPAVKAAYLGGTV